MLGVSGGSFSTSSLTASSALLPQPGDRNRQSKLNFTDRPGKAVSNLGTSALSHQYVIAGGLSERNLVWHQDNLLSWWSPEQLDADTQGESASVGGLLRAQRGGSADASFASCEPTSLVEKWEGWW